jgi:hypothetical protein
MLECGAQPGRHAAGLRRGACLVPPRLPPPTTTKSCLRKPKAACAAPTVLAEVLLVV